MNLFVAIIARLKYGPLADLVIAGKSLDSSFNDVYVVGKGEHKVIFVEGKFFSQVPKKEIGVHGFSGSVGNGTWDLTYYESINHSNGAIQLFSEQKTIKSIGHSGLVPYMQNMMEVLSKRQDVNQAIINKVLS
jgi:hypothetical protein